jgi:hypothetical protein
VTDHGAIAHPARAAIADGIMDRDAYQDPPDTGDAA